MKNNYNNFYIYGKHPILMALKNKKRNFYKIYTSNVDELKNYLDKNNIKINANIIEYKNNNELTKILNDNVNHQGYAAIVSSHKKLTINDFIEKNPNCKELPKLLILDQLTDPHNIGAIIRTAVAFDINYIITTKYNSPKDSSIIVKSSAGVSEIINIVEVVNINQTIDLLKNIGYFIIGLAGETKNDIKEIKDKRNICLVIGNEGTGIRQLVKKNCDALYKITMQNNIESLNVSVATALAIYELWS